MSAARFEKAKTPIPFEKAQVQNGRGDAALPVKE
jgi:hypothetical protein